jgi:hypothetical protein
MTAALGRFFAEEAFREGIPLGAVVLKCRNRGVSGRRAAQIAEEAAAEAYRRSLDRVFQSAEHFRAWITRTALNAAVDILRREGRTRSVSFLERLAVSAASVEVDTALVSDCLSRLSALERGILHMIFEERLTLDEIAARVLPAEDGSPNARRLRVKRKRDRALAFLRDCLAGWGAEPDEQGPRRVPLLCACRLIVSRCSPRRGVVH